MRISDWSLDVCASDLEREQGFGAGHAGQSLGEWKALVLRPAGVVARRQYVDRAVLDRGEAGVAVILRTERRRQAREGAEIADRGVGEQQVRGGDAAQDGKDPGLGGADERSEARRVGKEWVRTV